MQKQSSENEKLLEELLGKELNRIAADMVINTHTPADDNKKLAELRSVIKPISDELIKNVKKAIREITNKLLTHAGEGMIMFYKQGFYHGADYAGKIISETQEEK